MQAPADGNLSNKVISCKTPDYGVTGVPCPTSRLRVSAEGDKILSDAVMSVGEVEGAGRAGCPVHTGLEAQTGVDCSQSIEF